MQHLEGLAPLASDYDGFIVDLWGVVHDGVRPYPGAPECLSQLRREGKRVVLLSNAPRRAAAAIEGLRSMGIGDDSYDFLLTSGEATRDALIARDDPWFAGLGNRVWLLGPERDRPVLDGTGLIQCERPDEADFVLNTGTNEEQGETDPEPYLPVLQQCAALRLPMVCANPDLEVIRGGRRLICAGLLARFYAGYGGEVREIGKPHPLVYDLVRRHLDLPAARILAVGDALATDIKGAKTAGIPSCWVLGGIHGEMIGDDHGLAESEAAAAGLAPVATIPRFVWAPA